MKTSKWFTINIILVSLLFVGSCKSQIADSRENAKHVKENPLEVKIENFYSLFETMTAGDINCDDLISKGTLGKEVVQEYVNSEVRNWSDSDWKETVYNAIKAIKKPNYYLFAIEKEGPGTSEIFLNTYSLQGIRQSSILVCKDSPTEEVKSRISEDFSIFKMDDAGVSTYKINSNGKYVKGQ